MTTRLTDERLVEIESLQGRLAHVPQDSWDHESKYQLWLGSTALLAEVQRIRPLEDATRARLRHYEHERYQHESGPYFGAHISVTRSLGYEDAHGIKLLSDILRSLDRPLKPEKLASTAQHKLDAIRRIIAPQRPPISIGLY